MKINKKNLLATATVTAQLLLSLPSDTPDKVNLEYSRTPTFSEIYQKSEVPIYTEGYPDVEENDEYKFNVFRTSYMMYNYKLIHLFIITPDQNCVESLSHRFLHKINAGVKNGLRQNGTFKMHINNDPSDLIDITKCQNESSVCYTLIAGLNFK